mmetsp:Transcript_30658/g.22727  ORF Transcript_30658/g.22727 Transcript_30658/m.22727 type:complete len:80 (+) Transcript_30658:568-807(+)
MRTVAYTFCERCQYQREHYTTVHCDECNVCVEEFDHHCVFFSKCIGGGNIVCFWATLVMVVLCFAYFAFMTVVDMMGGI